MAEIQQMLGVTRIVAIYAAIVLAGCVVNRAQDAENAQTKLVGLSQERLLACIGEPANKAVEGSRAIWSYNSDTGFVAGNQSPRHFCKLELVTLIGPACVDLFSPTTPPLQQACTVNIVVSNARVTQVNYVGPTGEPLTHGEQCRFAIETCVP